MSRQTICFKDTNHVQRLVVLLPESSQPKEMTVESRPAPPDPILPLLPAAPMSNATPLNRHKASTVPFYRPKCIKKLHLPCQHINLFLININSKTDRQSSKSNKTVLPALFQIWTNLCGLGLAFEWACTTHSQELISSHMWKGLSQMSPNSTIQGRHGVSPTLTWKMQAFHYAWSNTRDHIWPCPIQWPRYEIGRGSY
jgi:hypothetical protein